MRARDTDGQTTISGNFYLGLLDLFSRRLILGRATGFFMALTIPIRSVCARGERRQTDASLFLCLIQLFRKNREHRSVSSHRFAMESK